MQCPGCGNPDHAHHHPYHNTPWRRRRFLRFATASALLAAATSRQAAADVTAPPKPGNILSPDAALNELLQGNARYVQGFTRRHDFSTERAALALGQNPYAGVLSCADSRVAPEFAFDSFRGDLFVVRVAGNFLNTDNLASFEYAVAVLKTPLLMVLGHSGCGAVSAAIKSLAGGPALPGHLPALVDALTPAVKAAQGQPGDLLTNAIKDNVRINVARLHNATPILSQAVADKKLRIAGGYYNLASGHIDLLG